MPHDLPCLELDRCPRGDDEAAARLIWIAADPWLGQPGLKDPKITQLDSYIVSQAVGNVIERSLDHIENLMLYHSCLIANGDDDVSFCELTHNKTKSLVDIGMRGKNCEKIPGILRQQRISLGRTTLFELRQGQ